MASGISIIIVHRCLNFVNHSLFVSLSAECKLVNTHKPMSQYQRYSNQTLLVLSMFTCIISTHKVRTKKSSELFSNKIECKNVVFCIYAKIEFNKYCFRKSGRKIMLLVGIQASHKYSFVFFQKTFFLFL